MPQKLCLDKYKKAQVCGVLSIGGSMLTAARAVGCHPSTIYATAKRDPEFAENLAESRAGHEVALLNQVHTAAKDLKYWRAAAWALERMYPERYRARAGDIVTLTTMRQFIEQLLSLIADEVGDTALFDRIVHRTNHELKMLSDRVEDAIESPTINEGSHDDARHEHNGRA